MNNEYDIRFWQDDIWAVYPKDQVEGDYLYKGTLTQVNAWLELRAKGFNL